MNAREAFWRPVRAAMVGMSVWAGLSSGAWAQGEAGKEAQERFAALQEAGIRVAGGEGLPEESVARELRLTSERVTDEASLKTVLASRGLADSAQNVALVKELNPELAGGKVPEGTRLVLPEVVGPPELTGKMRGGAKIDLMLNADAKQVYLANHARLVDVGNAESARFTAQLNPFTEAVEEGSVHVGEELILAMAADAERVDWLARNPDAVPPEVRKAAFEEFGRTVELRNLAVRTGGVKLASTGDAWGRQTSWEVPVTVTLHDAAGKPVLRKRILYVSSGDYAVAGGDVGKLATLNPPAVPKPFGKLSTPSEEKIVVGAWCFWAAEDGKIEPLSEVLKKEVKPSHSQGVTWELQMKRAD